MFEFINDDKIAEYDSFLKSHVNGNFLQAPIWSQVKKEWDKQVIVSRDNSGNIRAGIMILIRKVPVLPYTFFYAPRGPVCNSDDLDGLNDLVCGIKELSRIKKGYIFIADPAMLSSDEVFIRNAIAAGFKIRSTGDFDGIQKRHTFRLNIENKTEDEIFNAFHSKTRYNIRLSERKGVTVRIGDESDLPEFHTIMQETGERDNFRIRSLEYFQHMYSVMAPENMRLYVAEYEGKTIAGTIAIYCGDKVWYLYGASSNAHRNVMPNYLLQWKMIQWAIENKCRIYDFRGVSGNTSPDDPQYGLYRFKKGFSGDMIEFVGELEMVFKPIINIMAKIAQKILK